MTIDEYLAHLSTADPEALQRLLDDRKRAWEARLTFSSVLRSYTPPITVDEARRQLSRAVEEVRQARLKTDKELTWLGLVGILDRFRAAFGQQDYDDIRKGMLT